MTATPQTKNPAAGRTAARVSGTKPGGLRLGKVDTGGAGLSNEVLAHAEQIGALTWTDPARAAFETEEMAARFGVELDEVKAAVTALAEIHRPRKSPINEAAALWATWMHGWPQKAVTERLDSLAVVYGVARARAHEAYANALEREVAA